MDIYIDTEFSMFNGELISMAAITPDKDIFYEVRYHKRMVMHQWVKDNVIPILNKEPVADSVFRTRFWEFLAKYPGANIYADWPEDLAFFLQWMCKENGIRLGGEYQLHLIHSGHIESKLPHNAMWDAFALMEWHQSTK